MAQIKSMKTIRWNIFGAIIIIAAVLGIAWFYKGGEHFKGVASVCYGFLLGWIAGFVAAKAVYQKKTG
ncbi:MAG: hypothetical protein ACHQ2F_10350 [Desulfobaccales bacterium]